MLSEKGYNQGQSLLLVGSNSQNTFVIETSGPAYFDILAYIHILTRGPKGSMNQAYSLCF